MRTGISIWGFFMRIGGWRRLVTSGGGRRTPASLRSRGRAKGRVGIGRGASSPDYGTPRQVLGDGEAVDVWRRKRLAAAALEATVWATGSSWGCGGMSYRGAGWPRHARQASGGRYGSGLELVLVSSSVGHGHRPEEGDGEWGRGVSGGERGTARTGWHGCWAE